MQATFGNWNDGIAGWAAALVYMGIIILTFIFLIMYIKRMITIAFLILISPIITITYSVDKISDGKSQALDTWVKEFLQNVLIQPFHCIIYLVFISVSMSVVNGDGTLAAGIIVVITMFFIFEAEKIIKNIFGINSETTGSGMKTALTIVGTMTALKKLSEKKSGGSNKASQPVGNVNNVVQQQPVDNSKVNQSTVAVNNLNAAAEASNVKSDPSANINSMQMTNLNNIGSQNVGQGNNVMNSDDDVRNKKFEDIARNLGLSGTVYTTGTSNEQATDDDIKNKKFENVARNLGLSGVVYPNGKESGQDQNNNINGGVIDVNTLKEPADKFNEKMQEQAVAKNEPKKKISGYKILKKAAKKYMSVSYKGAMAFTGITAQGVSGDASPASLAAAGVAGYQVGKYTQEKAGQVYDAVKKPFKEQVMKHKERNLSSAYNNYKTSNNFSDAQMDRETQKFMKMDESNIKDIKNKDAQVYAKALKSMPQTYADNGYEDPNQELQNTLNRIKAENKRRQQKNMENNAEAQRRNANVERANINNINDINRQQEEMEKEKKKEEEEEDKD